MLYSIQTDQEDMYPSEKPFQEYGDKLFDRRGGRGTGWFGTGFYGFSDKSEAKSAQTKFDKKTRIVDLNLNNPLKIKGGFDEGLKIHNASRDIWRINPKTKKVESYNQWQHKIDQENPQNIIDTFNDQGIKDLTIDELIEAKKQSKIQNKQPINIILEKRGYDGIIPPHSMENTTYGAIKFDNKKRKIDDIDLNKDD